MQCNACGHESTTFDPFITVSVPVGARVDGSILCLLMVRSAWRRQALCVLLVAPLPHSGSISITVTTTITSTRLPIVPS